MSQSIFLYAVKGETGLWCAMRKQTPRLMTKLLGSVAEWRLAGPGPVQVQAQTWGMVVTGAEGARVGKDLSSKSVLF